MKTLYVAAIVLMISIPAWSQFQMENSNFSNGGTTQSSSGVTIMFTVGESLTGQSNGDGYGMDVGYSYEVNSSVTGVEGPDSGLPMSVWVGNNYPNPFNPSTSIEFGLPREEHVSMKLFDVNGRVVMTLVDGQLPAGTHTISINGSRLSSGLYFCRLITDGFTDTRKITLVK